MSYWAERERHLVLAYEQVATLHNALGVTDVVQNTVATFHVRQLRGPQDQPISGRTPRTSWSARTSSVA
jgi:hypothetical protein